MALSASYMRRLNNDHTKTLLAELDAFLPQSFRSKPARNGAGVRAMVRGGRSMNDVLSDIAQFLKHIKSHPPPASPPSSLPAAAVSDGLPEEAILFYARGLLFSYTHASESRGAFWPSASARLPPNTHPSPSPSPNSNPYPAAEPSPNPNPNHGHHPNSSC